MIQFYKKHFDPGFRPKRMVFEGPSVDYKAGTEVAQEKVDKILKNPDSFDPEKDFNESKAKIDDIAKKNNVDTTKDKDYQEALNALARNRDAFKETQNFAKEKIKSWPTLKGFVDGQPGGGKMEGYEQGRAALKMFNALNSHFGPMAGVDTEFVNVKNQMEDNIHTVINSSVDNTLILYEQPLDDVLKADKFDGKYMSTLQTFQTWESTLVSMQGANFEDYSGDKSGASAKAKELLAEIAAANKHIAELDLKAADDNLNNTKDDGTEEGKKRVKEAMGWQAGAEIFQKMEISKSEAVKARIQAELPGADPDKIKAANDIYAKAEKIMNSDYVGASKLFDQAKQAYDQVPVGEKQPFDNEKFNAAISPDEAGAMKALYRTWSIQRTPETWNAYIDQVNTLAEKYKFRPSYSEMPNGKPYSQTEFVLGLKTDDNDTLEMQRLKNAFDANPSEATFNTYMDQVAVVAAKYGFEKPPRPAYEQPAPQPGEAKAEASKEVKSADVQALIEAANGKVNNDRETSIKVGDTEVKYTFVTSDTGAATYHAVIDGKDIDGNNAEFFAKDIADALNEKNKAAPAPAPKEENKV